MVNRERLAGAQRIAAHAAVSVETAYWTLWRIRDDETMAAMAVQTAAATGTSVSSLLAFLPMPSEPYMPPAPADRLGIPAEEFARKLNELIAAKPSAADFFGRS